MVFIGLLAVCTSVAGVAVLCRRGLAAAAAAAFTWLCFQLERAIDGALPDYVAEPVDE